MNPKKNLLEWTVFWVALAIVSACMVVLIQAAVRSGDEAANLVATTGTPERVAAGFLVPVRIENRGDRTAAEVTVAISIELPEGGQEQAELSFAFIPRNSFKEARVLFRRDPSRSRIQARAIGYSEP